MAVKTRHNVAPPITPAALCLAGPTASGKSSLALRLAKEFPVTLINTDSLQIYKGLPTLTALPSSKDLRACPHKLYSFLEPYEAFSVARWQIFAKKAYFDALQEGHFPLFVGGTGLYFKTLTEGLSEIPPITQEINRRIQKLFEQKGLDALYQDLKKRCPEEANRLKPGDTARIQRSLAVLLQTGKPLSWWHQQPTKGSFLTPPSLFFTLLPERSALYQKAEMRFDFMIQSGALEEIKTLMEKYPDFEKLPVSKALGARELAAFLKNNITLDEASQKAKQETRRYIKRQMTWFRHQVKKAIIIESDDQDNQYDIICKHLEGYTKNFSPRQKGLILNES